MCTLPLLASLAGGVIKGLFSMSRYCKLCRFLEERETLVTTLQVVTSSYKLLQVVISSYKWLQVVTSGYK